MSKREVIFSKWIPVDFISVVMTPFSNSFFNYDVMNRASSPKYNFCVEISKLSMLFFHNSHTHQPPIQFLNHRRLERFKKILYISKVFGPRGGGTEILTMKGEQKCQI